MDIETKVRFLQQEILQEFLEMRAKATFGDNWNQEIIAKIEANKDKDQIYYDNSKKINGIGKEKFTVKDLDISILSRLHNDIQFATHCCYSGIRNDINNAQTQRNINGHLASVSIKDDIYQWSLVVLFYIKMLLTNIDKKLQGISEESRAIFHNKYQTKADELLLELKEQYVMFLSEDIIRNEIITALNDPHPERAYNCLIERYRIRLNRSAEFQREENFYRIAADLDAPGANGHYADSLFNKINPNYKLAEIRYESKYAELTEQQKLNLCYIYLNKLGSSANESKAYEIKTELEKTGREILVIIDEKGNKLFKIKTKLDNMF